MNCDNYVKKCNFNYISDDEIGINFSCNDGIHLLDSVMNLFTGNFVNGVNSTIFNLENLTGNCVSNEQ